MWWLALVLSAVPAEQWADEAQVEAPPAVLDATSVGPVVGAHLGASLGNDGPDFGGRLGARFALARHVGLSVFADAQFVQSRSVWRCFRGYWECGGARLMSTLLTGIARVEFITDGSLGPFRVPAFTAGLFVGGGVGLTPETEYAGDTLPASVVPFMRGGVHLGITKLPNGWWFPFFVDLGVVCSPYGCNELGFVAGVGL